LGEEFGGSNPKKLERLQKKYFTPLGARLVKIPLGRKEHNGRVERSHRTDDEEFYIPFLAKVQNEEGFLRKGAGWVYYNLKRPHYGEGMEGKPPFSKLQELGCDLPEEFALFPPLVQDRISADWALAWALRGGNHLLAHYSAYNRAKWDSVGRVQREPFIRPTQQGLPSKSFAVLAQKRRNWGLPDLPFPIRWA